MAKETCVYFFEGKKWLGADCPKGRKQRKHLKEFEAHYKRQGFGTDICTTHRVKRSGRWVFRKTVCRKRGVLPDGKLPALSGVKKKRKRSRKKAR